MSKTRNLSDLLDANGDVKSTALDNVPASNDASALTTGTLPNARLSAVPNSALANSSITINGSATSLGGSATINTDLVNDTTPQLGGDLASNGNNINIADNDRINFGADSDLRIYHDGTNSRIGDFGTGDLIIFGSSNVLVNDPSGNEMIRATSGSSVQLKHNNSTKLETTSTGATVTGTLTATAFSGDGSGLTGVAGVPSGIIAMWSGSSASIPSGWYICDGNNGTPNLTDKFIKASSTAGSTGGSTTSGATTLSTSQMPSHSHSYYVRYGSGGTTTANTFSSASNQNTLGTTGAGGSGSHTHSVEPPYYTLIFIMKA